MEDTAEAPAAEPKPKSRKMLYLIIIASVVLAAGGTGGFFYYKKVAAEKAKAELAKKSAREKADAEAKEAGGSAAKNEKGEDTINASLKIDLPDDKEVRKVIALEPFVVNLIDANEPRYLRMSISIGIGDTKEEKTDPLLTTRVRNAILAVLTTKSSTEVLTPEGKSILRKEILRAARAAVEEPRIEAIYITDFIIQM